MRSPATVASGRGRGGELGHQLHRDREREHRPAVDAVVAEVAVARELEACRAPAATARRRRAGRTCGLARAPASSGSPARSRSASAGGPPPGRALAPAVGASSGAGASPVAAPITTSASPLRPWRSSSSSIRGSPGRARSARRRGGRTPASSQGRPCPRARHGPQSIATRRGAGQRAIELVGELAEHLARGRVVGLTAVAEAAGDRAEQHQEAQALRPQPRARASGAAPALVASTRSSESSVACRAIRLSSITPAPWITPSIRPWRA